MRRTLTSTALVIVVSGLRRLRADQRTSVPDPPAGPGVTSPLERIWGPADIAHWRRQGEDGRASLIVTGSMKLRPAPSTVTQRVGRATAYILEPGFFLESRIIVIDGATGAVVASEALPRQARYGAGRRVSPLSLYLGMMNTLIPDLVRAITVGRSDTHR